MKKEFKIKTDLGGGQIRLCKRPYDDTHIIIAMHTHNEVYMSGFIDGKDLKLLALNILKIIDKSKQP